MPMSPMRPQFNSQKAVAGLELAFAGALWGFGFIAAMWALEAFGPITITASRFLAASGAGLLLAILLPSWRKSLDLKQLKLAFIPGALIAITLIFQTWGMKYTTATKSGFITVLYVLMVPFLESRMMRRPFQRMHLIFACVGLIGVGLICDVPSMALTSLFGESGFTQQNVSSREAWNRGDVLTLICAAAASLHIVWFARINDRISSPFVFNTFQSFWAGILASTLLLFASEDVTSTVQNISEIASKPWMGLAMLSFGSTLIAFALQVRAQKIISPTHASLLFLLESPFAAVFAIYFLNESLRSHQWVGAGLIAMATVLSTLFSIEESVDPSND